MSPPACSGSVLGVVGMQLSGLLEAHLQILGLLLELAVALGDPLLLLPAALRLRGQLVAPGPLLPPFLPLVVARQGRLSHSSSNTVSSCEYAGAQQHSSTSGSSRSAQSLCTTPGEITTQSPARTGRSASPSRIRPLPSVNR